MFHRKIFQVSFQDILKTSFVFVFRRCLQGASIKTNIFALLVHFQDVLKMSSSRAVKRGNFYSQDNFDHSGSFVNGAMVRIHKCLYVASAFMEINDWCLGCRIYILWRPCLHRSNLKTSCKFGISQKNWAFSKTVPIYS